MQKDKDAFPYGAHICIPAPSYTLVDLFMTQDERDIAEAMRELDAEFPGYREYGEVR